MSRFTLHDIRRIVERIERPLGHATRVLHRFSNALNMRIPLNLPHIQTREVDLPWPIKKHLKVPRESYMKTYLSPHQIFSQRARFGQMGDQIVALAMRPMRPLLGMFQKSIVGPFEQMNRLMAGHIDRLLGFGNKVMQFTHRARRVRMLLKELDLETIAKSLRIHP